MLLDKLSRYFSLFTIDCHPWSLPQWVLVGSLLEVMHRGALGVGDLTWLWWAGRIRFPTNFCGTSEAQRFCYIFESFSELENLGRGRSRRNDLADISVYGPIWKRKAPKHAENWGEWLTTSELQSLVLGWRPGSVLTCFEPICHP